MSAFIQPLPVIPVTLPLAAIDAFNEEFTLPAAPLSELWSVVGKQQALDYNSVFWAWLIHFLQDVFIFTFYAMFA